MAHPDVGSRIAAGTLTTIGLSVIWFAIITSLPSQSELADRGGSSATTQRVAAGASPTIVAVPQAAATSSMSAAEPEIDLSIPGVPSGAQTTASPTVQPPSDEAAVRPPIDARAAQVAKLKCEAEVEQLCPDMGDGPARTRCLEQRAKSLTPVCRTQMQERFVRWKEDRVRLVSACQEDVKRLCASLRPGDGRVLQCLQDHSQEVSDRCYQTLPKGKLLFRQ